MALELVSGTDFWQIDVPGKPRRSRGVPGSIFGLKPRRTGPNNFSQTAFKYQRQAIQSGPSPTLEAKKYCYQIVAGYVQFDVRAVDANNPVGRPARYIL